MTDSPRPDAFRVELTADFRVRVDFRNAAGDAFAHLELDPFAARRLANVLNQFADIALVNSSATRGARTKPGGG